MKQKELNWGLGFIKRAVPIVQYRGPKVKNQFRGQHKEAIPFGSP